MSTLHAPTDIQDRLVEPDDLWDDPAYTQWLTGALAAARESADQARRDWTAWADAAARLRQHRPRLRRVEDPEGPGEAPVLPAGLALAELDNALSRVAAAADAIAGAYRRLGAERAETLDELHDHQHTGQAR